MRVWSTPCIGASRAPAGSAVRPTLGATSSTRRPKRHRDEMHQGLDAIFEADDQDEAREAFNELAADLEGQADRALETLELGLETGRPC